MAKSRARAKQKEKAEKKPKKKERGPRMADKADRHILYQESVQCVEAEVDFVVETFQALRNRPARKLREDFCGTANTASEWIRRHRENQAIAVDIDTEVLDWGRRHNAGALGDDASRLTFLEADVREANTPGMDVVLAMNFSYWLFRTRTDLRAYFEHIRSQLTPDGIFFLDAYGGYEAFQEMNEQTKYKRFTYVWDQARYNPITGEMWCHIHFHFPDGSRMKKAFSYHWRLWTLPEIQELLREAGFSQASVYWEGTDEDGEGDGNYEASEEGEADAAWVVYIVAQP